jgi:hypothetical protein
MTANQSEKLKKKSNIFKPKIIKLSQKTLHHIKIHINNKKKNTLKIFF